MPKLTKEGMGSHRIPGGRFTFAGVRRLLMTGSLSFLFPQPALFIKSLTKILLPIWRFRMLKTRFCISEMEKSGGCI